ncbi:MAG: hypothetical protein PHT25_08290 [Bacteroidales bacterium]|nr:hypothetical protein [Bacteroidales bacterium]
MKGICLSLFLCITLLFSAQRSFAQFYNIGNDPAGKSWREIDMGKFRIIYPQEIDSIAQRYAYLMNSAISHVPQELRADIKPFPVILHPYTTMSNGVVVWAPKRMELMTRPLAFRGYSQNWEKQLVLHETRHVAQMTKFGEGVFRPLSWLLGEQIVGLAVGLYIDKWALEGDAVVSETEFSRSGRGRDPEQMIFFKASFLDGDYRNWHQWKLGSGRLYTPDMYSLGYFVHSHIRSASGNNMYMGDLTDYLVKKFYNPSASRNAYKSSTGYSIRHHFENIKHQVGNKWRVEDSLKRPFTPYKRISLRGKDYSSYRSVVEVSPDTLFAIKSDMDEPERLLMIDSNGVEKRVTYVGNRSSYLKYVEGRIYWTEQIPSTRWELESYSVLRCYDVALDEVHTLSNKTSYYNPSFSLTGDTVAVSEYMPEGGSKLVLLDRGDFSKICSYKIPDGGQVVESVFYNGDLFITVISETGMGVYRLDSETGSWICEVPCQNRYITRLNSSSDGIIFESDLNGTNNLYCYNPDIKYLQRLTNARFGAFEPCVDKDGGILYSEYDSRGYFIAKAERDSLRWEPASFSSPAKDEVADLLSLEAGYCIDTVMVGKDCHYDSTPFKKGENLFKIHSWAPVYYNVDKLMSLSFGSIYEVASPGATIYSQNLLGTAVTMLGYSYSQGFHAGHMSLRYSGLYPVVEVSMDYNTRWKRNVRLIKDINNKRFQLVDPVEGSPEFTSSLLAYLPLRFSGGGWNRGLIPSILWRFSNDAYYSIKNSSYNYYQYLSSGIQYYSTLNRSSRDIFPKWGLGMVLKLNEVPFSNENYGYLFYSRIYAYMPGLLRNHGLKLDLAFQYQNYVGKNYLFYNIATSPRGYDQLYGKRFYSVSADYALPLYLGDIQIGTLTYLKRLQVIPFVDYAYNVGLRENKSMFSAGTDLLLDFNALNIPLGLSAGLRYARTAEKKNYFQMLFNIPI